VAQARMFLAGSCLSRDECERAISLPLERALALEPALGAAYAVRGRFRAIWRWDWAGAAPDFDRAVELSPADPYVRAMHAAYLSRCARHREAMAEAERAVELDPLNPFVLSGALAASYFARDYDATVAWSRRMREADPRHKLGYYYVAMVEVQRRDFDGALAQLRRPELAGDTQGEYDVLWIEALAGRPAAAVAFIESACGSAPSAGARASDGVCRRPIATARMFAALGDKDRALSQLESALARHWINLELIAVQPEWDSLRDEPRFRAVLRAIGLPQALEAAPR
jgi:tetratricopeptide (TPR) repeat protein